MKNAVARLATIQNEDEFRSYLGDYDPPSGEQAERVKAYMVSVVDGKFDPMPALIFWMS